MEVVQHAAAIVNAVKSARDSLGNLEQSSDSSETALRNLLGPLGASRLLGVCLTFFSPASLTALPSASQASFIRVLHGCIQGHPEVCGSLLASPVLASVTELLARAGPDVEVGALLTDLFASSGAFRVAENIAEVTPVLLSVLRACLTQGSQVHLSCAQLLASFLGVRPQNMAVLKAIAHACEDADVAEFVSEMAQATELNGEPGRLKAAVVVPHMSAVLEDTQHSQAPPQAADDESIPLFAPGDAPHKHSDPAAAQEPVEAVPTQAADAPHAHGAAKVTHPHGDADAEIVAAEAALDRAVRNRRHAQLAVQLAVGRDQTRFSKELAQSKVAVKLASAKLSHAQHFAAAAPVGPVPTGFPKWCH